MNCSKSTFTKLNFTRVLIINTSAACLPTPAYSFAKQWKEISLKFAILQARISFAEPE